MKLVRPFAVTDAALSSSNVYETPPATYAGGTTYALGAEVTTYSGKTGTVYRSLQAGNTGNTPSSSPLWWEAMGTVYAAWSGAVTYAANDIAADFTEHKLYESVAGSNLNHNPVGDDGTWWLELGPTNLWAMFDQKTGTQTQWLEQVQVVIDVTGRMDTVGLLNLSGTSVNITMMDGATEIHNQDYSLTTTDGIDGWYSWFFEPLVRMTDLVVTSLPINADPEVTISVTAGDGDTVSVGNMILGRAAELGGTQYGARVGITDYSRITTDDFGNYTIVQRGYSKVADIAVWITAENSDYVYNTLAAYRATPVLMIGADGFTSLAQYGLLKDWRVALQYVSHSVLDLQFQGI